MNIADLDQDRGTNTGDVHEEGIAPDSDKYLSHWRDYNLLSSNVLGPAVAATYDNARLREVELDRILWFTHPLGDGGATDEGKKLGTAGAYPDALRTFGNKATENVFLKPNQYLVVGPEKVRSIGSAAAKTDLAEQQFGQDPLKTGYPGSFIDLSSFSLANLPVIDDDQKYQFIEATANIGGRGFNISEPLWTASAVDPYYADQNHKISNDPGLADVERDDIAQMYIVHPQALTGGIKGFFSHLFSTHPDTKERIRLLEQY